MDTENLFEYVFNGNDINIIEPNERDLKCLYIQYLLEVHNKSEKIKKHFDWGIINSDNKNNFLWGTNPIINLLASRLNVNDLFQELIKNDELATILTGMEFGARSKKLSITKDIEDLKIVVCRGQDCLPDTYKSRIISMIQKDPLIFNHDGCIRLSEFKNLEDAEKSFKQILFERISQIFKSKTNLQLLKGKIDAKTNFGIKNKLEVKNSDLIFLILQDGKYKLISIELKFGKNESFVNQCIKNHIMLSKMFKDAEVFSIIFSPYEILYDLHGDIIRKLHEESNRICEIPLLLIDAIEYKDKIFTCFGKFEKEEQSFVKQLKDQNKTEKLIEDHIDYLKENIREIEDHHMTAKNINTSIN